jgi:hypothetical protein
MIDVGQVLRIKLQNTLTHHPIIKRLTGKQWPVLQPNVSQ